MSEVTPPLFLNVDSTYTAASLGLPYRDLVSEGVVGTADLKVSQRDAGANMSVDVASGVCWVAGDDNANLQPIYRCYNNATVNLAITTANVSNPRNDIVIAEVRDSAFSGVNTDWRLRVVTGTAAVSPGTPTTPNNSLLLAIVNVPAAAGSVVTANITDKRPRGVVGIGNSKIPAVRAYRTATQSLTNSTWTSIALTSESFDTEDLHDTATNNSRVTIKTPGIYQITGHLYFGANTTGSRQARIYKNGATTLDYWTAQPTTTGDISAKLFAMASLAQDDYIEMQGWHNVSGGSALAVGNTSEEFCHLNVTLVSGT